MNGNQIQSVRVHAEVIRLLESSPDLFYFFFQCFDMWNKERGYPISINVNYLATKAILQAMRTIAHPTCKGWDNTGNQSYPMVQPADVMINPEALNHTWEPKLFLEDVFQRHPQFRVWYNQRDGDILKAIDGRLTPPPMSTFS